MMSFKLSLKNIRKSVKDYTIYFLTLILGVAIFYMFNSLDSQSAMMEVTASTREIIGLMMTVLSGVSVFVALILGFLIVYANNFLIKRRKKEFAVYMTLGMGKGQISRMLLGETLLIGLFSLAGGLALGIFASQFMSILVAKMFEADMTAYAFVFSQPALVKTIVYFGIMYLIVLVFNAAAISKYKLIDLFQAAKKTEQGKLKSSGLSVLIFLLACVILGCAYYQVTVHYRSLSQSGTLAVIAMGCIGTFLVFWSLSGFLLNFLKRFKGFYYRGLNSFILRQVNSSINTTVFSMTIICLLFFVTISVLSSGLAMNNALKKDLQTLCPRDMNVEKEFNGSELTALEKMTQAGFDSSLLASGYAEVTVYNSAEVTWETMLGNKREEVLAQFPFIEWNTKEDIVGLSAYNRLAAFYGLPVYDLAEDEYLVLCNFDNMKSLRNMALAEHTQLVIGERVMLPKYDTCQDGYLLMSASHLNVGVLIVPDSVIEAENGKSLVRQRNILAADYAAETKAEKAETEEQVNIIRDEYARVGEEWFNIYTKIEIYETAGGLAVIVTFIAIYLGVIFLIAGVALLALKELSESTDNRARYAILNKIGVDKKMQRRALLGQMGIFFGMPMVLAIIHSIFGIQYAGKLLSLFAEKDLQVSIVTTAVFLLVVYGGYFIATYFGSRRIIEE